MARIRTIKPEFCSSTDVGKLSRDARLFFLQLLTEADDEGRMLWIPRRIAGVLYPHDNDVGAAELEGWADECERRGMVRRYGVGSSRYLSIVNWAKHQKISHATKSRLPPPPENSATVPEVIPKDSGTAPEVLRNDSGTSPEVLRPDLGTGNREGEQGKETTDPDGSVVPSKPGTPPCPHEEIVALYHDLLPALTRVKEWTTARQKFLRKRWNENHERQNLDWWREFFGYVAKSDFLTGKTTGRDGRSFDCDLEWLVRPKNFVNVIEGRYENRGVAA